MNPLQETQNIIERLLFRVGDEQVPMPDQVLLVVTTGDQVMRYLIQSGTPTTIIYATVVTIETSIEDGSDSDD